MGFGGGKGKGLREGLRTGDTPTRKNHAPFHPLLSSDATGGQILKGHQGPVWGLATAPAPAGLAAEAGGGGGARSPTTPPLLLLTCASDKAAKVWALPAAGVAAAAACGAPCRSAPPPAPLRTLSGHHTDWVRACDLNASTSGGAHSACCALTGGDDGRAVLWDVEAGSAVRVVRQDGGGGGDGAAGCRPSPVRALRFLPGGASGGGWCSRPELVFAAGALDGSLTLWDARTSEVVAHLVPGAHGGGGVGGGVAHRGGVTALASCSPCAAPSTPRALLASVGADGAARAWDLRSRAEAGPPYIAACALNAVAFTPCGGGVAVGGEDGRVCMVGLWTAPPLQ